MYLYVFICIYMYLYVFICIYMYLYVFICIYMYLYVFICIYMYLYVFICIYMYLYVFICIYMYLYVFICIHMYLWYLHVLTKTNYMLPHGRPEQSVPAPGGHKCLCAKVHANCVWHVVLPSRPCETRWCSPGDGLNETHIHNAEVHSKHCAVPMFAFRLARPKAIAIYTRSQQDQQISCQ